jgi:hypothetical protein
MQMQDPSRPRLVVVTRRTGLELLLERHGTLPQARFYLASREQPFAPYEEAHERFTAALATVESALPSDQRRVRIDRDQLDRFLFAPDDVVWIVGQDGLVPNVAKYLSGQLTLGVNPDPQRYDGVLCAHPPAAAAALIRWLERPGSEFTVQPRCMAAAVREDGQTLLALNEIFIGHRSHQSARYRMLTRDAEERQSSSGIICATGTGCSGWARSIRQQRGLTDPAPSSEERRLAWFVREPFPSVFTGTRLDHGTATDESPLRVRSEMGEGGLIFADGIESDFLDFLDGHAVTVAPARQSLRLVVPVAPAR